MSSLPPHMIRGKMTALFSTDEFLECLVSSCLYSTMVVKAVQYLRAGIA